MNKADRKRITQHLKNHLSILQISPFARDMCKVNSDAMEQLKKDIEKTEQWEPQKGQSL